MNFANKDKFMYMRCSQILSLGFIKDLFCMDVLTYMSVCVSCAFRSPWSSEESARTHGTDDHMGTMNFVKTCSLQEHQVPLPAEPSPPPCLSYFSIAVSSLQL